MSEKKISDKRKKIQDKVLEIIGYLDSPDRFNYNKYKSFFDTLSDEQFGTWCNWCNDPGNLDEMDHTIQIQTMPFQEPSLDNIFKGLDALGVPAEEYVYYRMFSDKPVRSKYPIPVGYAPIKRMEQLLSKKNHYTVENDKRSIKTDQVSGESAVASISEPEAVALMAAGADNIMKELYGSRSGDEMARNKLYKQIALNGYATIEEANSESTLESKTTLNFLNTYLLASGIRTDLIEYDLTLPYTDKKRLEGGKK